MRTGNWGHGKAQAVPTVSSYTVMKQTKMEGVTERHLPKTDESIVRPGGECRYDI